MVLKFNIFKYVRFFKLKQLRIVTVIFKNTLATDSGWTIFKYIFGDFFSQTFKIR